MEEALRIERMAAQQDQRISEEIRRQRPRLWNFIRKRVPDEADAEDILQEVFYELLEAYRLMKPVEQVGAWLFRVARNRITDVFPKRKPEAWGDGRIADAEDGDARLLGDLPPPPEAGPAAPFGRTALREGVRA